MADFDDAFDELYRRAYRVAFRVLGSRAEAEDVAQEACARAYVSWKRIAGFPEAWVSRVSTNLAIDRWRRLRRRLPDPVAGAAPDPHADERIDLQRALRTLPRRQREVVVLRYLADQSEEAVAGALGCSVGTVKSHASRGLAALRARLGDVATGSP